MPLTLGECPWRGCLGHDYDPTLGTCRHQVDLPAVILHGRELGRVEAIEPPAGVGLPICNLGDPCPPPPLPDPEVGPRRLPGPREDGEILEPA